MPAADAWPGESHRSPRRSGITYHVRAALSAWLREEGERAGRERGRYRVLDVGCGVRPYYPYFAPSASEYVGVDVDNPEADIQGSVEELPVADGAFDVVLCTQVLEHVPHPGRAVRELYRVTAPGGRVLASTHGVQVYHPSPTDYWRWTHAGLEELFGRCGEWSSVRVDPVGGAATCLAAMSAVYADLLFRKAHLAAVARAAVWTLNGTGGLVDRLVPPLRRPVPGSLFLNFHVTADKGGA